MGDDAKSISGAEKGKLNCGCLLAVALLCVGYILLSPVGSNPIKGPKSGCVQCAHLLGLAMYSYANDHQGAYPTGNSSTEVFQQLLDGGYISDPAIFYEPMDGKTKAASGQKKLKPENVCWDVTADANTKDPGGLPLVFLTGYRVTYVPKGGMEPLVKPYPPYRAFDGSAGLAVFFLNNSAAWIFGKEENVFGDTKVSLAHLVPPDFDAHGKTYRQLTPDGVLR